jgi:hypothetical protein
MKKQILLIAALSISLLSFAQSKTSFGVRAGVSYAGLRGDAMNSLNDLVGYTNGWVTSKDRVGFFAGGFADIPLTNSVSLEPGIYYTQKGYIMKGELGIKGIEFLGANAKAALNTHYIDVPVLLKANVGGLQLFAGPQFSYLAKADLRTTAGAFGFNVYDKTYDATDQINRLDASLTGGIGYQFSSGLNIMASYDHGLSKVDAEKRYNAYNRSVKIGVGFRF